MGLRATGRRMTIAVAGVAMLAAVLQAADRDPLAQAVVDSLASSPRTTPAEIFDAVVKCTKVRAFDVATRYLAAFGKAIDAAGDRRPELLADLGDAYDDGTLLALERRLAPTEPAVAKIVDDVRTAARLRRRDPVRLAAAIADLTSDSFSRRTEATRRLSVAGPDALGVLVGWLGDPRHADGDDASIARGRGIVAALLQGLGEDGVVALLGWLGTPDVPSWPGILSAIELASPPPGRVRRFLLAPALVVDTPPAARRCAVRLLGSREGGVPTKERAAEELVRSLDGLLCADDDADDDTEQVPFWDVAKRTAGRMPLASRRRRALEAAHLARDLAALVGAADGQRKLIHLARLESTLVAVDRDDPEAGERIVAALTGPDGFSLEEAAGVLDEATHRGMTEATEAAATVIGMKGAADGVEFAPAVRRALAKALSPAKALSCGDLAARFAAARALAIGGPRGPYAGKSRVVETLLDCAGSTGIIRAVVAHPQRDTRRRIAAAVAALGYTPTEVVHGRDAVVAAREACDTRLVVLATDLGPPGGHETAQFLARIPSDGPLRIVHAFDEFDVEASIAPVSESERKRATERLGRAGEAIRLLSKLARDSEPVGDALPVALEAANHPELAPAAIELLSLLGRPDAQAALHAIAVRPNTSDDLQTLALEGFRASVGRFGILLETCDITEEYRRYNTTTVPAARRLHGLVLDVLEAPTRRDSQTTAPPPSGDAPNPQ